MNISDFHCLYRRTITAVGVENGSVSIKLDRVAAGKLRVLTHVTVENLDNGTEIIRLAIHAGGRNHYLDELLAVPEAELCVSRSDILLGEGDVFFAELTGTDGDDRLVMTCIGWEQRL